MTNVRERGRQGSLGRRASGGPSLATLVLAALILTAGGFATARAQESSPARNKLFVELLGHGIVYSINYQREVTGTAGVRVGLGGLPTDGNEYIIGFGMIEGFKRRGGHSVHVGLGLGLLWIEEVWLLESEEELHAYGALSLGYEYHPRPRGIFFRAAFTPLFTEEEFAPWLGVGVGTAF